MFQLIGISKHYIKNQWKKDQFFPVLKDFHLHIKKGSIHALVGASGCGKTTLARIMMRLESYDNGKILYRGQSIEEVPLKQFRLKNQMMFQNPLLSVNPYFTIEKIISEPMDANGWKRDCRKERVEALMSLVELPVNVLKRKPSQLSGGQLQRVALARALSIKPDFLLLDEPFSSLDAPTALRLSAQLKEIFRSQQMTVLIISHQVEYLNRLADEFHSIQSDDYRH